MKQNNSFNGKEYSEVWAYRFQFFEQNGRPSSELFRESLKKLSFIEKLRINFNFYAFVFGFIYFLVKGMHKAAISLLAIQVLISIPSFFLPNAFARGALISVAYLGAMTANYTFYRKEIMNEDDHNPFIGMKF